MHTFVKHALWGVAIAGGLTLLGTSSANAAETSGEDGLLSGTQIEAPLSAPIEVLDNAIAVLGDSDVTSAPAPAPAPEPAPEPAPAPEPEPAAPARAESEPQPAATTDGSDGIVSGSQAVVDTTLPVTVTGNAISVLGESSSSGTHDVTPATEPSAVAAPTTDGSDGVASGSQALIDVSVPVTIGGNGISVLGESSVVEPGSVPVADPVPGTDPGADPGVTPGTTPGTTPGATLGVVSALSPATLAAGEEMLTATGGFGLVPLALAGIGLLGSGVLLMRRRVS